MNLIPGRTNDSKDGSPATRAKRWIASSQGRSSLILAALGLALLGSYWTTLARMAERWQQPQYSHGFLVPGFALVVLWSRRQALQGAVIQPSWWGLVLLGAGLACRLAAARMDLDFADGSSLLLTLAGLTLLLGGWGTWRWAWPAIAFLAFMLPMPYMVETALGQPLRRLATGVSTYVLQTLGYPALAEGNVIHIEDLRLGVIDACSGLGMLVTFFALATALALIARAPLVDRLVIVASAIPIALIANVARITATAVAHYALGSAAAKVVMHDLAGWLMMPLALALLWLELRYLALLFEVVPECQDLPLPLPGIPQPVNEQAGGQGPKRTSPLQQAEIPSLPVWG